jgi:hypothetical protein
MLALALAAVLPLACGAPEEPDELGTFDEVSVLALSSSSSCYNISSNGQSTGQKCFDSRQKYCASLCAEKIPGAAQMCKASCGTSPAPAPAPSPSGSYCYALSCQAATVRQCFADRKAFCSSLCVTNPCKAQAAAVCGWLCQ